MRSRTTAQHLSPASPFLSSQERTRAVNVSSRGLQSKIASVIFPLPSRTSFHHLRFDFAIDFYFSDLCYVLFLTVLLFTCTSSIDSLRICRFVFRTSRLLLRFSLCVRFRVSSLRIYRFVFRTSHLLPASRSSRYACSRFVLRFYAISSCLRRFVFLTVPKRQPPGGKLSLFSYCAALIAARSSS